MDAISFPESAILLVCAKDLEDAWSLMTKAIVGSGNEIGVDGTGDIFSAWHYSG